MGVGVVRGVDRLLEVHISGDHISTPYYACFDFRSLESLHEPSPPTRCLCTRVSKPDDPRSWTEGGGRDVGRGVLQGLTTALSSRIVEKSLFVPTATEAILYALSSLLRFGGNMTIDGTEVRRQRYPASKWYLPDSAKVFVPPEERSRQMSPIALKSTLYRVETSSCNTVGL